MSGLSDAAVRNLRQVADWPDPGERYDVLDLIAQGGMGKVYRARDRELEREIALKVLSVAWSDPDVARRMVREARILAGLEHPGIVPVHDVGHLPDGRVFYTMKLVRGERLDGYTRHHPNLDDLLRVFERICESVAFAHGHGVIHRDLKPANVMVGAFGEVLVMDWGVAKVLGDRESEGTHVPAVRVAEGQDAGARAGEDSASGSPTRPGVVLGTPGYMAPEQAAGEVDAIDERTDVFALGMILSGLVAGAEGKTRRPLLAIIARATEPDPDRRYPGVAELAADVASYRGGLRVAAHAETTWERASRIAYRFRTPILVVLVYAAMRLLILWLAGT